MVGCYTKLCQNLFSLQVHVVSSEIRPINLFGMDDGEATNNKQNMHLTDGIK